MGCNSSKELVVPDFNQAKHTIQSGYTEAVEDFKSGLDEETAATRIQASFRGYQVRAKNKISEHFDMSETGDKSSNTREDSAAKINSGENQNSSAQSPSASGADDPAAEPIDIDLEDPDVAKAASKIQMKFRSKKK